MFFYLLYALPHQNLRWPRELNVWKIEKKKLRIKKQLHHFDNTRAANAHNTNKQRNVLQIEKKPSN